MAHRFGAYGQVLSDVFELPGEGRFRLGGLPAGALDVRVDLGYLGLTLYQGEQHTFVARPDRVPYRGVDL